MRKIMRLSWMALGAVAWMMCGCASTDVMATYTVAPRVLKNLESMGPIKVEADIVLSGNAVSQQDAACAQLTLQEEMVSRLSEESGGRLLAQDTYFASQASGRDLTSYLLAHGTGYGFAQINRTPTTRHATLKMRLVLAIDKQQRVTQGIFTLLNTPFSLQYNPYDSRIEPLAIPDFDAQTVERKTAEYSLWELNANGTLQVTLYDQQGQLVYERTFPQLAFRAANQALGELPTSEIFLSALAGTLGVSLASPQRSTFDFKGDLWPLPTTFGVIRRVAFPCLAEVVRDIMPNRQVLSLRLNEGGNGNLVMLIRGGAYRDALAYADGIAPDGQLPAADWENKGVACECLGQLAQAKYCYETALRLAPGSILATEGMARLGQ